MKITKLVALCAIAFTVTTHVHVEARAAQAPPSGGSSDLAVISAQLQDESEDVRAGAILALVKLHEESGKQLLIDATEDANVSVQAMAVDGLVDFYLPGYAKTDAMKSAKSFVGNLRSRFKDTTDQIVPAYLEVDPETVSAISKLVGGGASPESRANAARAMGVLRGGSSLEALLEGAAASNSVLVLECLLAIKKIGDPAAGPRVESLLDSSDSKIQEAAIQTIGQLRYADAAPELARLVSGKGKLRVRSLALVALAKIADPAQRELFLQNLAHKDKELRAAAAEGLGRVGGDDDLGAVERQLGAEKTDSARLSLSFAAVNLGNLVPLGTLVRGLESRVHRLEARPFLLELSRKEEILDRLYVSLAAGTAQQRRHLAYVIGQSGTEDSVPYLKNLSGDGNKDVVTEAEEAIKLIEARQSAP